MTRILSALSIVVVAFIVTTNHLDCKSFGEVFVETQAAAVESAEKKHDLKPTSAGIIREQLNESPEHQDGNPQGAQSGEPGAPNESENITDDGRKQIAETKGSFIVPLKSYLEFQFVAEINLGTPGQPFEVVFDTGCNLLWVPSETCYGCSRRAMFASNKSSTYKADGKSFTLQFFNGRTEGFFGVDNLQVGELQVQGQRFGEATLALDSHLAKFSGIFGLGLKKIDSETPTLFENLLEQGHLAKPVFSFYLDQVGKRGEICFGDIDERYFKGQITYAPLISAEVWEIKLDQVSVDQPAESTYGWQSLLFCPAGAGCRAVVDTGVSFIVGPSEMVMKMHNEMRGMFMRWGKQWALRDCDMTDLPNITFQIGGERFSLKPEQYIIRLIRDNERTCLSSFFGAQIEHWILGDTFVAQFYTVFDYGQKQIGFASAKTNQEAQSDNNQSARQ